MSVNENAALDVLHDSMASADLKAQVEALQEKLAEYEGRGHVVAPKFAGEVPRYRLNAMCFLEDDTLHVEGEEIEYTNDPNDQMVPLNDAAVKRMEVYLRQLQHGQRLVAEKNGRMAPGVVILDKGELLAQMGQDARNEPMKVQAVRMPEDKGKVFPMPHMPEAQAQNRRLGRGKTKGAAVISTKAPAPPKMTNKPHDVLGTRYTQDAAGNKVG